MPCAACQKARTALAGAGAAILHGDARKAANEAALVIEALGEKAKSESARIRSMLRRR